MEKSKKLLKEMSILILVFAAISLVRIFVNAALDGFTIQEIPEGVSASLAQGVYISLLVLSVIFSLPDIYVGVKGLKAAKEPVKTKGHIVWAKVLFVLSAIAAITSFIEVFKSTDLIMDIIYICDMVINVVLYYTYIKHATILRNASTSENKEEK